MIIDFIYIVILIGAVVKGLRNGFIIAIFSVLAFIIGLAAAMKLSIVVAHYLQGSTNISSKWLPFISFLIVFLLVAFLVRLVAKMLEKTAEFALLGWLNRLLGVVLYIALYTIVYSILLFYAAQLNLIKEDTILASRTYAFIEPWGPRAINWLGAVIPWFRDMFQQLKDFFGNVSEKASPA